MKTNRRTALKIMGGSLLVPMIPAPFTQAKETLEENSFIETRILIDAHREWVVKRKYGKTNNRGFYFSSHLNNIHVSIKTEVNKNERCYLFHSFSLIPSRNPKSTKFKPRFHNINQLFLFKELKKNYDIRIEYSEKSIARIEYHGDIKVQLSEGTYVDEETLQRFGHKSNSKFGKLLFTRGDCYSNGDKNNLYSIKDQDYEDELRKEGVKIVKTYYGEQGPFYMNGTRYQQRKLS